MAKKTYDISVPVKVLTKHSDIDGLYGPYNTREDAFAALPEAVREAPRTIAIKNAEGKNEEWWWKDGVTDGDLVLKESGDFIPLTGTEEGKPVTGAIQFEGDELEFYNEYNATLLRSGTRYGDGELEYVFRYETVPNLGDRDEIVINPFRNEIRGSRYVVPENEYNFVQKKYVDDNIIPIPYDDGNYVVSKESDTLSYVRADQFGQNIANSYQTSIQESGMTLGSPYTWNTASQPFSITGLPDKSNDTTFNKLLMENSTGQVGLSDGKTILKSIPSLLNESEKTIWKTEMNGGWTTNTMSVSSIFPPIIKNENENKFITLRGANLNLNPASFTVKIVSGLSTPLSLINVKTVPNNQVTLIDANTLNFYFNFNTEGLLSGEYKVVLNNGVSEYLSLDSFEIVAEVNYIDLSTITFNSKTYNDNPTLKMITSDGGGFIFSPDASVFQLGNDATNIFKVKSVLPIFNSSENFYLEFSITFVGATFPITATGINKIGLSTNNSVLLTNDVSYGFSNNPDSSNLRPFFNGVGGGYMPSSGEEKVVFIKKGGVLICQVFHKDYSFNSQLLYGNIDITSGQDLYIAAIFQNQSVSSFKIETTITAAYKF